MHSRCYDKAKHNYAAYGGRGIIVCARWHNFENFLSDMRAKPAGYTIERNNVHRDYEPANCRWLASKEQYRNTQRTVYVEIAGERQLLIDVCKARGLDRNLVYQRIKLGWSIEHALNEPVHKKPACIP